jgi:hypothetical protein
MQSHHFSKLLMPFLNPINTVGFSAFCTFLLACPKYLMKGVFFLPLSYYSFSRGMRGAQSQQELLPNYGGFLRIPNTPEPGDSTCLRLRKPNLDTPGPTLLNLQVQMVLRRTERTMFPMFLKKYALIKSVYIF